MREVNDLVERARDATTAGLLQLFGEPDHRLSHRDAQKVTDGVRAIGSMFLQAPDLDEAWGYRDPYRTRIYFFGIAQGRVANTWIQRVDE